MGSFVCGRQKATLFGSRREKIHHALLLAFPFESSRGAASRQQQQRTRATHEWPGFARARTVPAAVPQPGAAHILAKAPLAFSHHALLVSLWWRWSSRGILSLILIMRTRSLALVLSTATDPLSARRPARTGCSSRWAAAAGCHSWRELSPSPRRSPRRGGRASTCPPASWS